MDAGMSTGIAIAATIIAFATAICTAVAAKAARDQTAIQRQLRMDSSQPYVWWRPQAGLVAALRRR
jgi:hypothetical protein